MLLIWVLCLRVEGLIEVGVEVKVMVACGEDEERCHHL